MHRQWIIPAYVALATIVLIHVFDAWMESRRQDRMDQRELYRWVVSEDTLDVMLFRADPTTGRIDLVAAYPDLND